MRRPLVAVVAVLAVLLAMATAAVAVTLTSQRDEAFRGPGMMSESPWDGPGPRQGPRGWMHGPAVSSEFGYLAEMVAHHREAVEAATELQRSDRPRMRAFGAAIVESQSAQIDQMNQWLAEWYPGRSTDVEYRPMMRDLSGLSGDRLDRVFLEDMIPHHMAAVMMSQQLLMRGVADHEQVNELAESIRDEQHAEIFLMRRWLAAWFDTGWRHGPGGGMGPGMMR
ncbi:MAG TPA: DUF305 domain-containing protein [Nocardioidaceae bacterium]|nr:DUF305 domain-containing protein [Nocardioidaceae bacterium]